MRQPAPPPRGAHRGLRLSERGAPADVYTVYCPRADFFWRSIYKWEIGEVRIL